MRPSLFALALASCAAFASPAAADEVRGTRSELLEETRHDVALTLHRGWAELRVRRTVHNGGPRHDQAVFMIDLPEAAVATSLSTLGTLGGRPHWFAGELMEAEAAAAKYQELTGIGGYYPKDPALLSWRGQNLLALQVFPCAPGQDKSVEYTLLVPTRYSQGAHRVEFPGLGTRDRLATFGVRPAGGSDRLLIDRRIAHSGARVSPALDEKVELAIVPAMRDPLGGALAVAPFADHKVLTHFSFEAAPRVAKTPRGAYVVVAIDASHSIPTDLLDAQKTAAAVYLSHLPDAQVEVLTFDRKAHRRYGGFVPAPRAARELESRTIEQKNGSAVELALLEAERALAAAPADKPRRVLLMTDGLARSKLKPERLKAAVGPSSAIVHLAITSVDSPAVSRDDDHAWAIAPRATGGLLWQASLRAHDASDKKLLSEKLEEWVRPMRIDRFRLYSPDLALGDRDPPEPVLDEGEGVSFTFIGERQLSWIRAEGELWSKPIQHVVYPDAAHARRWAALVFGSELLDSLSEPEMMTLAMKGGAVSPVTSYLAIEPGVRPSTEGLDEMEGAMGFGSGSGLGVRMGTAHASGRVSPIDREAFLRDALKQSWQACGGAPDTGSVTFETTKDEVVDVTNADIGSSTDPVLRSCLEQAAWDLALTPHFDEEWNSWTIDV